MKTLTIASESAKGRAFSAQLVAYVTADALLPFGYHEKNTRPALLIVAGTESETRAFMANLRSGRVAVAGTGQSYSDERIELLRSGGYEFSAQRHPAGVAIMAYLPALISHDPGMVDPERVSFLLSVPVSELRPESPEAIAHVEPMLAPTAHWDRNVRRSDLPALSRLAPLFAAFLDRRTRCPLIPDSRFQLQLLVSALAYERQFATRSSDLHNSSFVEYGIAEAKLAAGLVFRARHEDLEAWLAGEVSKFYAAATAMAVAA